mgnify:CR=1 FL=1
MDFVIIIFCDLVNTWMKITSSQLGEIVVWLTNERKKSLFHLHSLPRVIKGLNIYRVRLGMGKIFL